MIHLGIYDEVVAVAAVDVAVALAVGLAWAVMVHRELLEYLEGHPITPAGVFVDAQAAAEVAGAVVEASWDFVGALAPIQEVYEDLEGGFEEVVA